ncbi:MAG: SAM-dependent methyltransferase [Ancalomicrobiaceae bacterium]|nr:SAM-dependent methyltransferase [Ancalomicrobiaceae bacterium]
MTQPHLFDRSLIATRRRRALERQVAGADFLIARVVDDLAERLSVVTRHFDVAVALGGATSHVADMLVASGKVGRVIRADGLAALGRGRSGGADLVCHEDALPFAAGSLNLIVSALTLQTIDDLPGVLVQARRALSSDGLLMAALLGGDTLCELRDSLASAEIELTGGLSPRVAPFVDVRDMGGLLQRAGLALPVTDSDRLTVRYSDMFALLRDLRAMGGGNPLAERSRRPATRRFFLRAAEIYAERHSDPDGRIRATFHIVSALGWAPSDTQQKPARPGSATVRLADALNAIEHRVGSGKDD